MRLPTRRVYRAFTELDHYSDADCRRFVARAVRTRWRSGVLVLVLAFVLGGIVWIGSVVALAWLVSTLIPRGGAVADDRRALILIPLGLVAVFGGWPLTVILARDCWLRRALRARLNRVECRGCGYSLLGLSAAGPDGAVLCPECGARTHLADAGLSQGDLLVDGHGVAGSADPALEGLSHPDRERLIRLRRAGVAPGRERAAVESFRPLADRAAARGRWIGLVLGALLGSALFVAIYSDLIPLVVTARAWVVSSYWNVVGLWIGLFLAYLAGSGAASIARRGGLNSAVARVVRESATEPAAGTGRQ